MSLVTTGGVEPALDGASIAGIVPAILGAREAEWLPPDARTAEQVVLLVLDGLGWGAIEEHRSVLPNLAAMDGGSITTVVPSTTATALTSISTGLAPAQHGIVGYRMLVDLQVLNVLRWSFAGGGRPPDPFNVQRHTAFLSRPVPVITRAEFRTTGFTQAHLRGGEFVGWHTTASLIEHCQRRVEAGERFVYAYYPGVDTVAHEFGLHDRAYVRELVDTDRLVGALRDVLPAHAALVVTSDHGQMHLERASWIDMPEVSARSFAMAGDGRFRYCYAHKGAARELLEVARDTVGDRGWVWSRAELLESGLLGTGATGTIPGRIGDVVLAAKGSVAFVDPSVPNEVNLRSGHGSLTPDEMLVPLLATRGGLRE
ncbi:MAG TPA: alkaline phosphatase family protein [Acidimicrobiia bacterium]|nr:alkaline phosphatase family protein [Acidimicrobiia bacterium]